MEPEAIIAMVVMRGLDAFLVPHLNHARECEHDVMLMKIASVRHTHCPDARRLTHYLGGKVVPVVSALFVFSASIVRSTRSPTLCGSVTPYLRGSSPGGS